MHSPVPEPLRSGCPAEYLPSSTCRDWGQMLPTLNSPLWDSVGFSGGCTIIDTGTTEQLWKNSPGSAFAIRYSGCLSITFEYLMFIALLKERLQVNCKQIRHPRRLSYTILKSLTILLEVWVCEKSSIFSSHVQSIHLEPCSFLNVISDAYESRKYQKSLFILILISTPWLHPNACSS